MKLSSIALGRRLLFALGFGVVGLFPYAIICGLLWALLGLPGSSHRAAHGAMVDLFENLLFLPALLAIVGFFLPLGEMPERDSAGGPALDSPLGAPLDAANFDTPRALARKVSGSKRKKLAKMTVKREARR